MFDKRILMNKKQMFLKKLIWMQMLGMTGGSLPWQTFTGNPLEFDAPKAHTLKSVTVDIEPIQSGSGDPSPDNVRPISGWTEATVWRTGENLWDFDRPDAEHGYYGAGGAFTATEAYRCLSFPCYAGLQLTKSGTGWGGNVTFWKDDTFLSIANAATVTIPNNGANIVKFACATSGTNVMLNLGSTASPYVPYNGSSVTVSFGQTVYGGTASYNGDGTWTVTVTEVAKHASDLTWANNASYANTFNGEGFTNRKLKIDGSNANGCYCDTYKWYTSGEVGASSGGIALANASSGSLAAMSRIYIKDTNFANAAAFTASFSEHDPLIVCPLATPTTFIVSNAQLFDALAGRNVMWTDCNNLTVEARGTAVELNALQSLNILLGNRYINNHTADDVDDDEALNIILGGNER